MDIAQTVLDNSDNPRERIMNTSLDLLYRKSYTETTIAEILEVSQTFKKSFYRYFSDKQDLGKEYLRLQGKLFLNYLIALTDKHPDFFDFWQSWISALMRQIERKKYLGCPFAAFAIQTPREKDIFQAELENFIKEWKRVLEKYLRVSLYAEHNDAEALAKQISDQIIIQFEGASALLVLTGDVKYFRRIRDDVAFLARQSLK